MGQKQTDPTHTVKKMQTTLLIDPQDVVVLNEISEVLGMSRDALVEAIVVYAVECDKTGDEEGKAQAAAMLEHTQREYERQMANLNKTTEQSEKDHG